MERQDAMSPRRQEEPSAEVDALAREVIGAAIEVHRQLGPGLPEKVYEEALCFELGLREVSLERQPKLPVIYKDHACGLGQLDIWVCRLLVVELKAVEKITPTHLAQAKAYLNITGNELALVMNFNEAVLKNGIHRVVWTR